jgi:hypothetical protein
MQLFIDCDGVLADFDQYFIDHYGRHPTLVEEEHGSKRLWQDLQDHEDYYFKLPLMPDAMELYDSVKHLNPIILTGRPASGLWAVDQKIRWTAKHFPGVPTIVCLSRDKCHHMTAPGDILVDDRVKYAPFWTDAGGVFVHHKSAEATIVTLERLGLL